MIELHNRDCLEVLKELPDKSIDLLLQDPPYNITACKWEWDIFTKIDEFWNEWKRVIKDNGAIVFTASQPFTSKLVCSNLPMFKYEWIWVKESGTGFLNAKKYPLKNTENIIVFCKQVHQYNPVMRTGFKPYELKQGKTKSSNYGKQTGALTVSKGERYPLTALFFNRDKNKLHPTQKPVALMEYLIKTYTNEGEIVFDGFMGSGTTGVAAKNLGRDFIGCELDKKYFDIAQERINNA